MNERKISISALLIVVFSAFAAISCFMPWVQFLMVKKAGYETDGVLALMAAGAGLVVGIVGLVRPFIRPLSFLALLSSVVMVSIPSVLVHRIQDQVKLKKLADHMLQPGLYLCAFLGLLIFVVSLVALIRGEGGKGKKTRIYHDDRMENLREIAQRKKRSEPTGDGWDWK